MKLKKVRIIKYKNLADCEINFEKCNNLAVVAGLNGSGKSNFLEALSLIVLDLNRSNKAASAVWPTYHIEYDTEGVTYVAERLSPEQEWPNWIQPNQDSDLEPKAIKRVVAMYSGQFCRMDQLGDGRYGGNSSQVMQMITGADLQVALLTLNLAQERSCIDSITYSIAPTLSAESKPEDDRINKILQKMSMPEALGDGLRRMTLAEVKDVFQESGVQRNCADVYLALDELIGDAEGGISKIVDLKLNLGVGESRILLEDLSEGEKRQILLEFLFKAFSGSDVLILLDEPDAHIHEDRKLELFDLLQEFAKRGVTTIMTTHSPALIERVDVNHLIAFKSESDGNIKVHQGDGFDAIADLTGSRLSFFSTRPLMLFEGKSDINILMNATRALRRLNSGQYGAKPLEWKYDMYFMGGANNAKDAVDLFRAKFASRKMIVVLDGDGAGRDAFNGLIASFNFPKESVIINQADRSWRADIDANLTVVIPPAPKGVTGVYGIEDYFKKPFLNSIVSSYLNDPNYKSYLSMPKIKQELKCELGAKKIRSNPNDAEFSDFDVIVDFLLQL